MFVKAYRWAVCVAICGGVIACHATEDRARTAFVDAKGVEEITEIVWKFRAPHPVESPVALARNLVFLVDSQGEIFALRRDNGTRVWEKSLQARTRAWPVVSGETLFIGTDLGHLHALDVESGDEVWRFEADGAIEMPPLVVHASLYFGSVSGHVFSIHPESGYQLWKGRTGGPITAPLTFGDQRVFVSSHDAKTYAMNADGGGRVWTGENPARSRTAPAYRDQRVVILDDLGHVSLRSSVDGELLWSKEVGEALGLAPVVAPAGIFVATARGLMVMLTWEGEEVWRVETDPILAHPVGKRQTILTGHHDGTLRSWSMESGTSLLSYEVEGSVTAIAADADRIYVADSEGNLYALR